MDRWHPAESLKPTRTGQNPVDSSRQHQLLFGFEAEQLICGDQGRGSKLGAGLVQRFRHKGLKPATHREKTCDQKELKQLHSESLIPNRQFPHHPTVQLYLLRGDEIRWRLPTDLCVCGGGCRIVDRLLLLLLLLLLALLQLLLLHQSQLLLVLLVLLSGERCRHTEAEIRTR